MYQESGHDSAGCRCLKVSHRLDVLARVAVSPEGLTGEGPPSQLTHMVVGRIQSLLTRTELLDWDPHFLIDYWLQPPSVPHQTGLSIGQLTKQSQEGPWDTKFRRWISGVSSFHLCHALVTRSKSLKAAQTQWEGSQKTEGTGDHLEAACPKNEVNINKETYTCICFR